MPNGLVFKCHLNTGQPNHLNTGQMDAILFSYILVWNSDPHCIEIMAACKFFLDIIQ